MRSLHVLALALLPVLAGGCAGYQHFPWFNSQRWPGPMEAARDPLPSGDATRYPPGPEEVRVLRHADPVQVRMAGSAGSIPLSYQRKEIRVSSGSGVSCCGGGRAEVLWANGSSVVFFGFTEGIVGSPSRGEPSLILRDIERVRFDPKSEDLYELSGGAMLRVRTGPVRVSRVRKDVLRVANESKRSAQIAFRDSTIVLDPGQAVELPILSSPAGADGLGPVGGERSTREPQPKLSTAQGPGFTVELGEGASTSTESGALVARGSGLACALGVRVLLAPGMEARFSSLARAPASSPPDSSPQR